MRTKSKCRCVQIQVYKMTPFYVNMRAMNSSVYILKRCRLLNEFFGELPD